MSRIPNAGIHGKSSGGTAVANDTIAPLGEHNLKAGNKASLKPLPTGRTRIRVLYEEYIHLKDLQQVWESPVTDKPVLEPCFAAGFHGIELCFLLLAEFISDGRKYVAKRPRVEMVAEDIATQCKLLTEVIDGELEEEEEEESQSQEAPQAGGQVGILEGASCRGGRSPRLSLTQAFPFEGCPPTTPSPAHSPGLQRLVEAVGAKAGAMSPGEQNSLIKLVLNLTSAFDAFQRWSVGLGIEPQLNQLRVAVGLPPLPARHSLNLDYEALVRPSVVERTLPEGGSGHAEDFFFRTVHLGTECWAAVAHNRISSAADLSHKGRWHTAAARAAQASHILHYLGSHVLLLTRLNLRDYLQLKVEIEGTSGEGSVQVKAFRSAVTQLLEPLARALLGGEACCTMSIHRPPGVAGSSGSGSGGGGNGPPPGGNGSLLGGAGSGSGGSPLGDLGGGGSGEEEEEEEEVAGNKGDALQKALLEVYEFPDKHAGLYNYAKALEDLETALLGGFYFKHFLLAANVIGSDARGTMRRAVQALKCSYETPVFPRLDAIRCQLGHKVDAERAAFKGRIMEGLLSKYAAGPAPQPTCPFAS